MRQWYPDVRDESLETVYEDLADEWAGRHVALNMVVSVDGAVAVDGVSGALGGEGDLAGFRALRAAADVVLAGAATVRHEAYRPVRVRQAWQQRRRDRGQAAVPPVAVVSRSCDLTGAEALLEDAAGLHVLTCEAADPGRRRDLEARGVTVVEVGAATVDVAGAVAALQERGMRRVLVEGGPSLNGQLLAAGLVDEVFVTLGARLVGSDGPGLAGPPLPAPVPVHLREGRVHGDELLLRYAVGAPPRG